MKSAIQILIFLLFNGFTSAKMSSKLRKQLQNSEINYNGVIIYSYGRQAEEFQTSSNHFNLSVNILDDCPTSLEDTKCLKQLTNVLEKGKKDDKIFVLLNGATNFANCLDKQILLKFDKERHKGKCYKNSKISRHGLNIIGDIAKIREALSNQKDGELFNSVPIDHDEVFFSGVEDWKLAPEMSAPVGANIFIGNPTNSEIPMFILQENSENSETRIFHHFINLILRQPFPSKDLEILPDVFVCLSVETNVLFFEEFLEAFLKQDYPRQKLRVQVQMEHSKVRSMGALLEEKIDPIKGQFKSFSIGANGDQVTARKKCIGQFINSEMDHLLILQNVAILDDASTISSLVKQNLSVTVPMMQTNLLEPTYERNDCDFGWGRNMAAVSFMTFAGHDDILERIKRGTNYVLFDTKMSRKTKTFGDDKNFWTPLDFVNKENNSKNLGIIDKKSVIPNLQVSVSNEEHCCLVRIEAFRYVYLLHKSVLKDVPWENITVADNTLEEFDTHLSNSLKRKSHILNLMTDKTYGQLVDTHSFPKEKKHPELFRVFENFQLWQQRYILPEVAATIQINPKKTPQPYSNYIKEGKCPNTLEARVFKNRFINELKEEIDGRNLSLWQIDFYDDYFNIVRFYIYNRLCYLWYGEDYQRFLGATILAQNVKVDEEMEFFDPLIYSHARSTVLLPLNEQGTDYQGGGWNYFAHNCSLSDLESGVALISPNFATHPFLTNPVTSGTFSFVAFMMDTTAQFNAQKHGEISIAGMTKV